MVYSMNPNKLPSYYRNAYFGLQLSVAAAEGSKNKIKLYKDFLRKFTMVPNLWIEYLKILKEANELTSEHLLEALKHFYSFKYVESKFKVRGSFHRCFLFQDFDQRLFNRTLEEFERYLTYPNDSLESLLRKHAEIYGNPPSKSLIRKHEAAKIMARKLEDAYGNIEKWFKIVIKTNNEQFIFQNIEFRIAEDPLNVSLWKLFIEYLDRKNHIWLLNVYSRYCRLFLEDSNTREEYYQAIEDLGNQGNCVSTWLLDAIMFEQTFKNGGKTIELLKKFTEKNEISDVKSEIENLKAHCEYITDKCDKLFKQIFFEKRKSEVVIRQNPRTSTSSKATMVYSNSYQIYPYIQKFSLPSMIINKIASTNNFRLATNLRYCCKHFMNPLKAFCYKLTITNRFNHFAANGFSLEISPELLKHLENIIVEKVFIFDKPIMASELPKFYKFDPEIIKITSESISWDLIKFLGNLKNLKTLYVERVIEGGGNVGIALEDILEALPNVIELSLRNPLIANDTFYKLSLMERKVQFKYLKIEGHIDIANIDVNHLCEFIKNNIQPKADIQIGIQNVTIQDKEIFKKSVEDFIETLPLVAGRPYFNININYLI